MEYPQRDSAEATRAAREFVATWEAWRHSSDAVAVVSQADGRALLTNSAFDRLWAGVDAEPELLCNQLQAVIASASTEALQWRSLEVAVGHVLRFGTLRLAGLEPAVLLLFPTRSVSPPDAVTGLADRRQLDADLQRRFQSGRPFALAFVDLDGFKQVNDDQGHVAGDQALREIAQRMRALLREHDTVSRYGGDEFVVLLDGSFDAMALSQIGERLRNAAATPLDSISASTPLSASIGWSLSADNYASADAMIAAADQRMYASKRQSC